MAYSVRLLSRAASDYRQMFEYIEARSPEGALRWEAALEKGLAKLANNPHLCSLAPESEQFEFELRQVLFKTRYGRTYLAVFRVDGQEVTVLRLCGPGQPPLSPDEVLHR